MRNRIAVPRDDDLTPIAAVACFICRLPDADPKESGYVDAKIFNRCGRLEEGNERYGITY